VHGKGRAGRLPVVGHVCAPDGKLGDGALWARAVEVRVEEALFGAVDHVSKHPLGLLGALGEQSPVGGLRRREHHDARVEVRVEAASLGGEALGRVEDVRGVASEDRVGVQVEDALVLALLPQSQLGGHVPPPLGLVRVKVRALLRLAKPKLGNSVDHGDGPSGDGESLAPLDRHRRRDEAHHVARRVEGADGRAEHERAAKIVGIVRREERGVGLRLAERLEEPGRGRVAHDLAAREGVGEGSRGFAEDHALRGEIRDRLRRGRADERVDTLLGRHNELLDAKRCEVRVQLGERCIRARH